MSRQLGGLGSAGIISSCPTSPSSCSCHCHHHCHCHSSGCPPLGSTFFCLLPTSTRQQPQDLTLAFLSVIRALRRSTTCSLQPLPAASTYRRFPISWMTTAQPKVSRCRFRVQTKPTSTSTVNTAVPTTTDLRLSFRLCQPLQALRIQLVISSHKLGPNRHTLVLEHSSAASGIANIFHAPPLIPPT